MAEEQKKEETKGATPEAPKSAEPAEAQAAPAETKAAPAAAAPAPAAAKPKEEVKLRGKAARPSNCAACNKSVKKTRWYYRNGKFYCTKTCWQTAEKKRKDEAAKAAGAPAEGAAPAA